MCLLLLIHDELMLRDIETRADLDVLMRTFYERVLEDAELGPKFADIDMDAHIPKILDFWQSTSIGGAEYTGSPFAPHKPLQLEERHFELWLQYFESTLNALFEGPRCQQIWAKAQHVANMFRFSLGLMQ